MQKIDVSKWCKTPNQTVSIKWQVAHANGEVCSGSTECEAWRAQYEIECLERAGYRVYTVEKI